MAPAAPAELSAAPHFEGPEGPTHLAIFEDRLCWTRKTWGQRVAPSTWRRGAFVWRETLPLAQSCVRLLGVLEEAQLVGVPPQSPQHSNLIQSHPISTSQHLNIQYFSQFSQHSIVDLFSSSSVLRSQSLGSLVLEAFVS